MGNPLRDEEWEQCVADERTKMLEQQQRERKVLREQHREQIRKFEEAVHRARLLFTKPDNELLGSHPCPQQKL